MRNSRPENVEDLNKLYTDSENADSSLFSEMRSNILLTSGEHYAKRGSRFYNHIRSTQNITDEQKLRLTKNHVQKIVKTYVNNIISHAPSISILPNNKNELQDQKAAELNSAVWEDLKNRHKLKKLIYGLADDFVQLGEMCVKVAFNKSKGEIVGYEQAVDELGQPILDEMGQPASSGTPIYSGDFEFERIYGFNLLRAPEAKEMVESPYLIYRKMVDVDVLKESFAGDEEKLKYIQESSQDTFVVFEGSSGRYTNQKNQVMVREFYFRPSVIYPNGYYFISTPGGILAEGELPFGIFPIVYEKFDEIKTSPRGRSIIKQLRPYQAEINRTASKIAETQITLGDDKILIQSGTKITAGSKLPGIRAVNYTGAPPTILAGRSGDQYVSYMASQIQEMYDIANIVEDKEVRDVNLEPYTLLYRSASQKKKFVNYIDKFEDFLKDFCMVTLELAKKYYEDTNIVKAAGRSEQVNIAEFKATDPLSFQIKITPQAEDVETKLGKQLAMTQVLQYTGKQLKEDDIGRIMRCMPYVNDEQAFGNLTIDYDNSVNDILALDRGEYVPASKYDNHLYIIKRLTHRMKQADFKNLAPEIQQNYERKVQEHSDIEAQLAKEIQAAKDGFIPSGGYMVRCDFYVPDPNNPERTKRASVPYESLKWLMDRLEQQGSNMAEMEQLQQGALADIASSLQGQQTQPALPNLPPEMGMSEGPVSPY